MWFIFLFNTSMIIDFFNLNEFTSKMPSVNTFLTVHVRYLYYWGSGALLGVTATVGGQGHEKRRGRDEARRDAKR